MRAQYEFAVGLGLTIEGDGATLRQFDREYGAASALSRIDAGVEVDFTGDTSGPSGATRVGGYKTMRWRTTLSAPADAVLGARIQVAGRPRGFARTLVQGYFIEPLLSVAAARRDSVLLPAAAFRDGAGAIVVLGRSGSGKTSLSMHALALGWPVFGDDQVIIDSAGGCRSFARRLRLYPDLRERVPVAYAKLPRSTRVQLGVRRFVRAVSRGAIAPSLAVPISIFGQSSQPDPAPITRVTLLERAFVPGDLRTEPATVAEAVTCALELLREQREHLLLAGGEAWREALVDAERQEEQLLEGAFGGASIRRIVVPSPLAGDAIGHVAQAVGLFTQPARQ
jgi:hypothetical protein